MFLVLFCTGLVSSTHPARAFSFSALKELILKKEIHRVEELLPLLPTPLRSHYALMFNSRSLQGSSFENPRVLMFMDQGQFMASFNGDPSQKAFDGFETMEFDPYAQEFNFREIRFLPKPQNGAWVTFSEANPDKCTKCHGTPARPIWDTHPSWPGAYGERYHAPLSDPEEKGLAAFLKAQPNHPRYKSLLNIAFIARKETFNPSHENRYNAEQPVSPNEELSRFLTTLNLKRILKQIQKSARFTQFQYALLAALGSDCESIDHFLPPGIRAPFNEKFKAFASQTEARDQEQQLLKGFRTYPLKFSADADTRTELVELTPFRFLVENGLSLSTDQWTTALETATYDFRSVQDTEGELQTALLRAIAAHDPELARLSGQRKVSSPEKYCNYLRKRSIEDLNHLSENQNEALKLTLVHTVEPKVLAKDCAACHDGTVGPELPFGELRSLRKILNQGKYPRGTLVQEIVYRLSMKAGSDSMPRGSNLTEEERTNLTRYFSELAHSDEGNRD